MERVWNKGKQMRSLFYHLLTVHSWAGHLAVFAFVSSTVKIKIKFPTLSGGYEN